MKGVAIVLVLSQVLLLPMMALASEENPRYHENYYALLSPTGELKQSSVVRQYEARGMQTVTDYGKYSSIKNLSNGVDAESDGERHVFHFPNGAPETLYIEGETTEPFAILPWKINISYELNGLTVDPSVLAGEKGLVKIHVDFTRNPDAQDYAKKKLCADCQSKLLHGGYPFFKGGEGGGRNTRREEGGHVCPASGRGRQL